MRHFWCQMYETNSYIQVSFSPLLLLLSCGSVSAVDDESRCVIFMRRRRTRVQLQTRSTRGSQRGAQCLQAGQHVESLRSAEARSVNWVARKLDRYHHCEAEAAGECVMALYVFICWSTVINYTAQTCWIKNYRLLLLSFKDFRIQWTCKKYPESYLGNVVVHE